MRFSLRTILIAFVMVGLGLATVLSAIKVREANQEIERVRNIYGLGGPGRYRTTFIGVSGTGEQQSDVCHLVRIDDPDEYVIHRYSYDKNGNKSLDETFPLVAQDLEFIFWCDQRGNFRFESLKGSQVSWTMWPSPFEPRKREVIGYYPYSNVEGKIDEGPFPIYIFCSPEVREMTNMQQIGLDEEKLKAWCLEHQARSICFEFARMDE